MEEKYVSIIIPTYREWHLLMKCIEALRDQTYPKESFEVIIVNNDPGDLVPQYLELPGNFKIIDEGKPGSYAARNAGLKMAKGEIIGFTDSDCIPDKNWIMYAVDYLQQNKTCSRIAGNILIIQSSSSPTVIEVYNKIYSFPQKAVIKNWGGSMTANLFTYRSVFEEVGWFDENYLSYGDLEWGSRANKKGFPIHYLEILKVHHPARSLKELIKKEKRLGGGTVSFHTNKRSKIKKVLRFLYQFRPRVTSIKYMIDYSNEIRLKDMILIPLIRYYFGLIRSYEILRVYFGKDPNRT